MSGRFGNMLLAGSLALGVGCTPDADKTTVKKIERQPEKVTSPVTSSEIAPKTRTIQKRVQEVVETPEKKRVILPEEREQLEKYIAEFNQYLFENTVAGRVQANNRLLTIDEHIAFWPKE